MSTTVQTNTTPKATSPRRSRFPGKESGSVSFNLTALGRQLLKEQAANAGVSNGDYVEMLIRERSGMSPLKLPTSAKQTGPKGGAKSYFFGKNRGTTTAVCVTPMAHRMLDEQVAASRMSRGDYIEYLLREKAGVLNDNPTMVEDDANAVEATNEVVQTESYVPTIQPEVEPIAAMAAQADPQQEFESQQHAIETEVEEPVVAYANPGTPVPSSWGQS